MLQLNETIEILLIVSGGKKDLCNHPGNTSADVSIFITLSLKERLERPHLSCKENQSVMCTHNGILLLEIKR